MSLNLHFCALISLNFIGNVHSLSVPNATEPLMANCSEITTASIGNLTFLGGEIGPLTNISWGLEQYGDLLPCVSLLFAYISQFCSCFFTFSKVSKFVVLYKFEEGSGVLCPTFNISKIDNDHFGCQANFTTKACNRTVHLSIESWTKDSQMLPLSHGKVYIKCNQSLSLADDSIYTQVFFGLLEDLSEVLTTTSTCPWTSWTSWSACSKTCGDSPGLQKRSRSSECIAEKEEMEEKLCLVNKCAQDCAWSTWSSWSYCSVSCGSGQRTRSRIVDQLEEYGGKSCSDSDANESEACLAHTCPVQGGWSTWSRWSYCNVTCGAGHRTRTRSCNNPKPQNGGLECLGEAEQVEECHALRNCQPIDGSWSPWSRWSGCSSSCGKGTIIRSRTCTSPSPQFEGKDCFGDSLQIRPCYLKKCDFTNGAIEESKDEEYCSKGPKIYGFLPPVLESGNMSKYSCYYGKVIDAMTNERHFYMPCESDYKKPERWPLCTQPKYCLGAAKKDFTGLRHPFPIRDVPVNSEIIYQCENGNGSVSASCCLDGIYR